MRLTLLLLVLVTPLSALAEVSPNPALPPRPATLTQAETEEGPDIAKLSELCLDQATCPCQVFVFTSVKPVAIPQPEDKPLPALW